VVRLEDEELLAQFAEALGDWRYDGFIVWNQLARTWLEKNLPDVVQKSVSEQMFLHYQSGGKIDQVKETRSPYDQHYEYHYDFRLTISNREVYIETVLDTTATGPTITIVNMHDKGLQEYEK
jgi:hypothetical protein